MHDALTAHRLGKLGDARRASQFASDWFGYHPNGARRPRHLYAGVIDATTGRTGRFLTARFGGTAADDAAMEAWLRDQDGNANIWFPVNDLAADFKGRGTKDDIVAIRALHADIDPPHDEPDATGMRGVTDGDVDAWRDAMVRLLRGYKVPPRIIVCTGRGVGAFWPLPEPMVLPSEPERRAAVIAKVEAKNLGLLRAFRVADESTRDITRIMKVPFTTAIPNQKKRGAGFTKVSRSYVVEVSDVG